MAIETPGKRFSKRLRKSKVFGHGHGSHKSTNADLLITPLVDMFVIIVLFLIANFSATGEVLMMSKDISLPEAKNVQDIQSAPVVTISKVEVLLSGKLIGRVRLPEVCANLCFGGPKRDRLFMAASQSLYMLQVATQGAAPG